MDRQLPFRERLTGLAAAAFRALKEGKWSAETAASLSNDEFFDLLGIPELTDAQAAHAKGLPGPLIEKRDGCHVWHPENFPRDDPRHGWTWDDCWKDAVALLGQRGGCSRLPRRSLRHPGGQADCFSPSAGQPVTPQTEESVLMSDDTKIGTIYFIGCDMGGWHTKKGDAVAVCRWDGQYLCCEDDDSESGSLFYPGDENGLLAETIGRASKEDARIIIGIDAALAWPVQFVKLVCQAPTADPSVCFKLGLAIDNPYLFRETDRFVKRTVLTGSKEMLLTPPGDKFGNNSSKAQALVEWIKTRLPDLYRPPFDRWDVLLARESRHTLIEILSCG